MEVLASLYLAVGLVAAVDAGSECRDRQDAFSWWADALAFAFVALLWLPIAAGVVVAHLWQRR